MTAALPTAPPATTAGPLLRLRGVSKHFGAVRALHEVDLDLPAAQVTALCGDNGAGKSTLTKCISGIIQPDAGEMLWEGRRVVIHNPKTAADLGIETVYQDLALADNLDIVQNMFLGRERLHRGLLDEDAMERAAAATLSSLRVTTVRSIRQPVGTLSGGQRQAVAVARAVMWNSKLVLLDEPTAALGVAQTKMVLELIRQLKEHGLAVMVISHNLNDVFEVADRIAILHLGRMVAQDRISAFDPQRAVDFMTTGQSERAVVGSSVGESPAGGSPAVDPAGGRGA
ncbi:MAG TPA: ATP-binding cassette domain-containing protein [Candidatus Limnocylindrales bacterium]|nr:ATP-binding cassette domain-containing protein [Candidatus Limnocylindrales bacterium]